MTYVEPTRLYSPASQFANMIVLRGLQPNVIISPNSLATSNITAVPEFGEDAPQHHASRWLPIMSFRSGCSVPLIIANTFVILCLSLSISWFCRRTIGDESFPVHNGSRYDLFPESAFRGTPKPSRIFRRWMALFHD